MRAAILVSVLLVALAVTGVAAANVQLINVTSPVRHGSYATISVRASARAECSIRVHYGSRAPITAAGLYTKGTLFAGIVQWRWQMSSSATRGRWTVDVSCGTDGSLRTSFLVT
jgi:hypothetical protein